MARKTQGVYDLVQSILQTLPEPYGEDSIEDVFVALDTDPSLLARYHELSADLGESVVNQWIGKYTQHITGMQQLREVTAKRTKLIKGYTKLVRAKLSI